MVSIKKLSHNDYTVGWICALPLERAAATAMLDEEHPKLSQLPTDNNVYTLGAISGHNVVISCLPSGVYGTASATAVAMQMRSTFPAIQFGLMVGIGGGAPSQHADI
jgi:nucleoside phosphorylase